MSSNDHYIVDYQKFGGIKLYKVHGFMGIISNLTIPS